jgi:hypothetical protein
MKRAKLLMLIFFYGPLCRYCHPDDDIFFATA